MINQICDRSKFGNRWRAECMVNKNFLIAEAGINHNGNIRTALKLVDTAKRSGADAIKFQTYITEKRVKKNTRKSLIF